MINVRHLQSPWIVIVEPDARSSAPISWSADAGVAPTTYA
jgi:hypothetical protein